MIRSVSISIIIIINLRDIRIKYKAPEAHLPKLSLRVTTSLDRLRLLLLLLELMADHAYS